MPVVAVNTNLARDSLPEFGKELSALVSKITGKEEWKLLIDINPGKLMYRNGTTDPCLHCALHSFTQALFTKEATGKFVKELTTFFHEKLGVANERISFTFHPISSGTLVGINGQLAAN